VLTDHKQREFQDFIASIPEGEIFSVALYGRNGELLASGVQPEAPEVPEVLKGTNTALGQPFERAGGREMAVRYPVENRHSCQFCHGHAADALAYIEVALSRSTARDAIGWSRQREFISLSVVLAVLVLALVMATELFTVKPMRKLIQTAKRNAKDPGELFPVDADDEVGELAGELNAMLAKIRENIQALESYHFETMRQAQKMSTIGELASALAHEIKNPMAGISGALRLCVLYPTRRKNRKVMLI
jgi:signal transduction histidine kinase